VDVDSAVAKFEAGLWQYVLTFNAQGEPKWTALTGEAVDTGGEACEATPDTLCKVAFVVDNTVMTAPTDEVGFLTGPASMSGGSRQDHDPKQLAAELTGGRVRLALRVQRVNSV
jgi:hypothetical protein